MKTIDLASATATVDELLHLAEDQNLLVRTADGKVFIVAEVEAAEGNDEFAKEVALTKNHAAVTQLLAERSGEPGTLSLDQVRQRLSLPPN